MNGRLVFGHESWRWELTVTLVEVSKDLTPKARLYGSTRFINAVESTKLNSTAERYCLHSSTKVNEAVDFKMAANELVREGVVVLCDNLMKECQHILEKRNKRKKRRSTRSTPGNRP